MNAPISKEVKKILREGNGRELVRKASRSVKNGNENSNTINVAGKRYKVRRLGI